VFNDVLGGLLLKLFVDSGITLFIKSGIDLFVDSTVYQAAVVPDDVIIILLLFLNVLRRLNLLGILNRLNRRELLEAC